MNYRGKGGRFNKPEDLKKIYGLRTDDYERLKLYVSIASVENKSDPIKEPPPSNYSISLVELNSADSAELVAVSGIGPYLASRIIKYRNQLGGYFSVEQLKEISNLHSETYDLVRDKLSVDHSLLQAIRINEIAEDQLAMHPYFKNPLAKVIISYRTQHGAFTAVEELKKIDPVSEELFLKMAPYIVL